jgi:hypothetical protein
MLGPMLVPMLRPRPMLVPMLRPRPRFGPSLEPILSMSDAFHLGLRPWLSA